MPEPTVSMIIRRRLHGLSAAGIAGVWPRRSSRRRRRRELEDGG
jgi:hypothetical protein